MSTFYLQSDTTAARRKFTFVCVDDTDGKTPEAGLTFSSDEVALRKPGTTSYTAIANIASSILCAMPWRWKAGETPTSST